MPRFLQARRRGFRAPGEQEKQRPDTDEGFDPPVQRIGSRLGAEVEQDGAADIAGQLRRRFQIQEGG